MSIVNMKKIFCLILAAILCLLVLSACDNGTHSTSGGGGGGNGGGNKPHSTETTPTYEYDPNRVAPTFDEINMQKYEDISTFEYCEEQTDYVLIDIAGYGKILIRLYPDVAPATVENFKNLVSEGFYDGLIFHRVIENFMIQGGDPLGTGTGGSDKNIVGEFESNGFENNLPHVAGVVSMARSGKPNSASSQFFICHKTSEHLDGDYAAFGYVVFGQNVVNKIANVITDPNDKPLTDVVITSIKFVKETQNISTDTTENTDTTDNTNTVG